MRMDQMKKAIPTAIAAAWVLFTMKVVLTPYGTPLAYRLINDWFIISIGLICALFVGFVWWASHNWN